MHDLGTAGYGYETPCQSLCKKLSVVQKPSESHIMRDLCIVKEKVHGSPRRETAKIRYRWIDLSSAHILPSSLSCTSYSFCLTGCKHSISYSKLCKDLKCLCIHC